MTNFPSSIDDDSIVPYINNNLSEIGADSINSLRDIAFALESTLGVNPQGSATDVSTRLNISFNSDGTLKSSALTSLGLVTLPIFNAQISSTAGIIESKLALDFSTSILNANIINTNNRVLSALGWINATGSKLQPHLDGTSFNHELSNILVNTDTSKYLKNKFLTFRNNSNSFTSINDLNDELLYHQLADNSGTNLGNIITHNGLTYPSTYSHISSSIYLNTSAFSTIPQTITDLQKFAQFIDDASIFLYGTRIQNFYSSGISRSSRASILGLDGYGTSVVPITNAIAYLLNTLVDASPRDNIDNGDDIIEFKPSSTDSNNNSFDAKFNLVKIGDIVRINYGTVEVPFVIKEKKYISTGGKKYFVRIAGKNLFYSATATARIDKPLFNTNKNGNLAIAAVNNNFASTPSLLIGSPKGAEAIGVGFNVGQLDSTHYNLYLALYPTGNPSDGYIKLPAIDVTGNLGLSPGSYTLDSIVKSTNIAFRAIGYNYRFMAFSRDGEFGIKLADAVNNAGFSMFSAVVKSDGTYDSLGTTTAFPNSVIDLFPVAPLVNRPDALGFDGNGSNLASPPYKSSYGSPEAAIPTKIFLPLNRETFYVNGTERDKVAVDSQQILDSLGNSYWNATVKTINPTGGRLEVTYHIPLDLSSTNLKIGKSILVQSFDGYQAADGYDIFDFGRFTISNMNVGCGVGGFTDVTVYDAAHATVTSPPTSVGITVGEAVRLYFGSEAVSFNKESSTDFTSVTTFKRHFEVYVDQNGTSFTHERARINVDVTKTINSVSLYTNSNIKTINIIKVSPNLRGYQFSTVNKISLYITSYSSITGIFSGYLCSYNGTTFTKLGPVTSGKKGETIRFYDNSNIDYIDFLFDLSISTASITNEVIDIQLFPSLANDGEIMLIGTCQLTDSTNSVDYIRDNRQFGNVSEKELSTSALDFLARPEQLMRSNGIISGFDLVEDSPNPNNEQLYIKGGKALVNGKIVEVNDEIITFPFLQELYSAVYYSNINWAVCLNTYGKYVIIPLLDVVSGVSTPSDTTRLFTAFNTINSSTYNLDATTFSNLINSRKDLVPVYYVVSTFIGAKSITLSANDIRRYLTDIDSNLQITVTSDNASGNFKSLTSAIEWLNLHPTFNNHVRLRGTFNLTSLTTFDFPNFTRPVVFEGDGATINVQVDNGIFFGSNVTFKNINFVYNFNSTTTTADFVNSGHGLMRAKSSPTDTSLTNFAVQDCIFSLSRPDAAANNQRYSYINFNIRNASMNVSNIYFINNSFTSVIANGSDFNAAISIVNAASVSGTNRPTLTNCYIEKNVCDSEQIIVITNQSSINAVANPGLCLINVNIEQNTCGSIGFISASIGTSNVVDQNNKINVYNNNVKYIANLDHQGKYVAPTGLNYVTGNIIIEKNNASFIHQGLHGSYESKTSLKILRNILTSNLSTLVHANDYLSNFGYPQGAVVGTTGTRYAVYVGNFDTNSKMCYTLIDGNSTGLGSFTGYECCIRSDTSTIMTRNNWDGMNDALDVTKQEYSTIIYNGGTTLNLSSESVSYSGIISNNRIARQDGTSVYAFLTTYDSTASETTANIRVTNNVFSHSITTHGSNGTYIVGKDASGNNLENFWTIEQNKNQIKYALIPLNNDTATISSVITQQYNTYATIVKPLANDGNILYISDIQDASNTPTTRYYAKFFNLKSYIPTSCRVLSVITEVYMPTPAANIDTTTPAVFTLYLNKSQPSATTMLDVKNLLASTPSPIASGLSYQLTVDAPTAAFLAAGNNPMEIDTGSSDHYFTGGNYDCNVGLVLSFKRAAGLTLNLAFSSILIKFTW